MTPRTFFTRDVDEANAIYSTVFYESLVEPVGRSQLPFGLDLRVDTAGPLVFGIANHHCETISQVGGLDMTYTVAVPLRGTFPFQFGQTHVDADPVTAVVATPTSKISFRAFQSGTEQLFILAFDRDSMDSQLRKLVGHEHTKTIRLEPSLRLRKSAGAQWWQMASTLALGLQSPQSLASNPLMTAQLSDAVMTGFLLAADHPYRDDLDAWARPMPPTVVRKGMEIIESRAHEPLTIPDIAAQVGCSLRTLQVGFRNHLDLTPHEYLVRVRLDRAHALLREANPTTATVTEIATLCGFAHTGRFAAAYLKVYNVSPHVTLRDG